MSFSRNLSSVTSRTSAEQRRPEFSSKLRANCLINLSRAQFLRGNLPDSANIALKIIGLFMRSPAKMF